MVEKMNWKEILYKDIQRGMPEKLSKQADAQSMLQLKARKWLVIFFAIMAGITLLTKAVDSVSVARIVTKNPSSDALTYIIKGNGIIHADELKYIKVPAGLEVDKIYVKTGQPLKKGDTLLAFNMQDISETLKASELELDQVKLRGKQEELDNAEAGIDQTGKAELLYDNSRQNVQLAKEDLQAADEKYRSALLDLKNARRKTKKELYQDKKEQYKAAEEAINSVKLENAGLSEQAERKLEAANIAFEKINSSDKKILDNLDNYYFFYGDPVRAQIAMEDLLTIAYGGEAYEKHQEEIVELQKKLKRANEDQANAESSYYEALYNGALVESYKKSIMASKRLVEDAKEALDTARNKDNNMKAAMELYVVGSKGQKSEVKEQAVRDLFQSIYGKSGYQKHQEEIADASRCVAQAEEDQKLVKQKCELSLSSAQEAADKIKKDLDCMKAGSYDYQNRIDLQKQAVTAAKQEKKSCLTALRVAKRNLRMQKLDMEQIRQQQVYQGQKGMLQKESVDLEIQQQQQTIDRLKELKLSKGKVKAGYSGMVADITLEAGKKTAQDTGFCISTGAYSILVSLPREEGNSIYIGNRMLVTESEKEDPSEVGVDSIRYTTNSQGEELIEIKAGMPEGDYRPGESLKVNIQNKSAIYKTCIPIMAIRWDENGSYVLTAQPQQTVLGNVLQAVRVPVTVLATDETIAAVSAALPIDIDVIVSSSKNISEGDRVRKN
jgi:hypothetical protein